MSIGCTNEDTTIGGSDTDMSLHCLDISYSNGEFNRSIIDTLRMYTIYSNFGFLVKKTRLTALDLYLLVGSDK